MKNLVIVFGVLAVFSCNSSAQKEKKQIDKTFEVEKTKAEWKGQLSEIEYYVLREAGTERAFSSPLNKEYSTGIYVCKACETPLFKSEYKFDSGSGWPSFDREIEGNVEFSTDNNLGYTRIEDLWRTFRSCF